ncbi:MAG: 5-(carboxyamino)imidazole ribonucleotide mutase [Clostridiaceae bacterium]|nr:5-(carboxyamino)imidazole ribonucleotide mutase [Clostridiaceae bacterium]
MSRTQVLIVMGSDSDYPVMEACFKMLKKFGVTYEAHVCSAHRSPEKAADLASSAKDRGFSAIIAAAGLAAHLPGVLAAFTVLPVIGIPCKSGALSGADALHSIVQMPAGVPVACVAIDGAANAALLAIQIIGTANDAVSEKLIQYKHELKMSVHLRNERLQEKLNNMTE